NPALQDDRTLTFVTVDNDQLIAFVKATEDRSNVLLIVINIDPRYRQSGWVDFELDGVQLAAAGSYEVHDLLTDARYRWTTGRNYVELAPGMGHIFEVRLPASA